MMKFSELFDLSHTFAAGYLSHFSYPWEALSNLSTFIKTLGEMLSCEDYKEIAPAVWVHKRAKIAQTASLSGPSVIGAETEVRHGAFLRGAVLVGENCVVGNSTELKNAILFDRVQVPHFNYVGDSILGYASHLGAGVITANVRLDRGEITVHGEEDIRTARKKCGAMVGDFAEVGCGSVLCPGVVIGRRTQIYPLSLVRGIVEEDSVMRADGLIYPKEG